MGHKIFITGGTGYLGKRLISEVLARGHEVRALVRKGSEHKLPPGCTPVIGDALDRKTFSHDIIPSDTFVQLVGVAHPRPSKAGEFHRVDLGSIRESVAAAGEAGVRHFMYVSVAQPAPIMKEYAAVRAEGEALIRSAHLTATILRPWYVLGPGHWWPIIFVPLYWMLGQVPATRNSAQRLGLVTLNQMIAALVLAIENPPEGIRILEVPEIRNAVLVFSKYQEVR